MISRGFFSGANNLGDSVAFNLESDIKSVRKMLIIGQSPDRWPPSLASSGHRNGNVFLVIPQQYLAQCAKAFEIAAGQCLNRNH